MKRHFVGAAALGAFLFAQGVSAYMITDGYVGSNDHGYGDVIGDNSKFEIFGADVSLAGTTLTVDLYTNFAGLGDDRLFSSYTNTAASRPSGSSMGIGYGDLFLSNSWDPYGTAPFLSDDNANGTLWTYGFAIDNPWSATGGSGVLYQLTGATNDANAQLSQDYISGGSYRTGQEVAVDTASTTVTKLSNGGTWSIDVTQNLLRFSFDIAGTSLLNGPEIALHWGMTCANDVIEGSATVPEPTSLALLGLGLIGLGSWRRTRRPQ